MDANTFVSKGGAFVKKDDLGRTGEKEYIIHDIDVAEFRDPKTGTERKLQLVLEDGARFTLNSTNTRILIKHYSNDTAQWKQKPVVLVYDESITYGGRMVG